jgi:3-oxoadipate enol-lactonase
MQRVDTGGFVMNAELAGPDGAPVVCLNHCFAADHGYWDAHLPALDGFRVLRYDTRGHGDSDAPPGPYTLEMLADDVARLCDVLGVDRVHFCGVSLGGQIAQTFALNYPQRIASLTIVNSTCEYSEEQTQQWRARAQLAQRKGMQAVHDALLSRWFTDGAALKQIPGYRYMDAVLRRFTADSFSAASEAMCGLDTTAGVAQDGPADPGLRTALVGARQPLGVAGTSGAIQRSVAIVSSTTSLGAKHKETDHAGGHNHGIPAGRTSVRHQPGRMAGALRTGSSVSALRFVRLDGPE